MSKENKDLTVETTTWNFDGKEYPVFIPQKIGGVALPIKNKATNAVAGIIGAVFAWDEAKPFLDHLSVSAIAVRNHDSNETKRQRTPMQSRNAELFDTIVTEGYLEPFDETGAKSAKIEKSAKDMRQLPAEIRSDLINEYLNMIHIERYFESPTMSFESLISRPESVHFLVKIGDKEKPTFAFILTFDTPTDEALEEYQIKMIAVSEKSNDVETTIQTKVNHKYRLQFAKKHLIGGRGVKMDSPDDLKAFKDNFCPNWLVQLAGYLVDIFNLTEGK